MAIFGGKCYHSIAIGIGKVSIVLFESMMRKTQLLELVKYELLPNAQISPFSIILRPISYTIKQLQVPTGSFSCQFIYTFVTSFVYVSRDSYERAIELVANFVKLSKQY